MKATIKNYEGFKPLEVSIVLETPQDCQKFLTLINGGMPKKEKEFFLKSHFYFIMEDIKKTINKLM